MASRGQERGKIEIIHVTKIRGVILRTELNRVRDLGLDEVNLRHWECPLAVVSAIQGALQTHRWFVL